MDEAFRVTYSDSIEVEFGRAYLAEVPVIRPLDLVPDNDPAFIAVFLQRIGAEGTDIFFLGLKLKIDAERLTENG